MTEEEVERVLIDCLNKVAGTNDSKAMQDALRANGRETEIAVFELDSLSMAEWCLEIERALDIELDPGSVEQYSKLGEVADYVVKLTR